MDKNTRNKYIFIFNIEYKYFIIGVHNTEVLTFEESLTEIYAKVI